MRFLAKILLTIIGVAVMAVALLAAAQPPASPLWFARFMKWGLVTAVMLPGAAAAALPWIAIDDASPPGEKFRVSLPLLALQTLFMLFWVALYLVLITPVAGLFIAMYSDGIAGGNWLVVAFLTLCIPVMLLLVPLALYSLYPLVIKPWRWRRWPLLTVAAEGVWFGPQPLLSWADLRYTRPEIIRTRLASILSFTGTEPEPGSLLRQKRAISLATLAGPVTAVIDAIERYQPPKLGR